MANFMDEVRAGRQALSQVDEWVARWHSGNAGYAGELREFLGLTVEQYAAWLRDSSVLADFV